MSPPPCRPPRSACRHSTALPRCAMVDPCVFVVDDEATHRARTLSSLTGLLARMGISPPADAGAISCRPLRDCEAQSPALTRLAAHRRDGGINKKAAEAFALPRLGRSAGLFRGRARRGLTLIGYRPAPDGAGRRRRGPPAAGRSPCWRSKRRSPAGRPSP